MQLVFTFGNGVEWRGKGAEQCGKGWNRAKKGEMEWHGGGREEWSGSYIRTAFPLWKAVWNGESNLKS